MGTAGLLRRLPAPLLGPEPPNPSTVDDERSELLPPLDALWLLGFLDRRRRPTPSAEIVEIARPATGELVRLDPQPSERACSCVGVPVLLPQIMLRRCGGSICSLRMYCFSPSRWARSLLPRASRAPGTA